MNKKLTPFGKLTLEDRYCLNNETIDELFIRVAKHYSSNKEHYERMLKYITQFWFMPSTPILSNGGTNRGLSISCFLSEAGDSMESLVNVQTENFWLAAKGGGIGTYFGNIRSLGEKIKTNGKTSGVIPFMKIHDSQTLAVSQGNTRKSAMAAYLPIDHPEIEEFIEIRRPTGGDPNRKCLNLHQGVMITDEFMFAVRDNLNYDLVSPKDRKIIKTVSARDIWQRLLLARLETGEPYLVFSDTINNNIPEHHKKLNLKVKMSNLCSEITLPTNSERTAVCCLGSINLENYSEFQAESQFIPDCVEFLDNVLQEFIDTAPESHSKAKFSAFKERSIGLGVMGLHGYYQKNNWAWNSNEAKDFNVTFFSNLNLQTTLTNNKLAITRGACPDSVESGLLPLKRFSSVIAIAPTASISIICGGASPGVEPFAANSALFKTQSGSFLIKNRYLEALLESKSKNTDSIWSGISTNEGSVQHLDFLSDKEKEVFKTANELNPFDIISQAGDRQRYICQSQSINLFLPSGISKSLLHRIHFRAWEYGLKSLYYLRSKAPSRTDKPSEKIKREIIEECTDGVCELKIPELEKYETCESCQ